MTYTFRDPARRDRFAELGINRYGAQWRRMSTFEKFSLMVEPGPADCWEWVGPLHDYGYGILTRERAHRVSHELFIGPIPEGLEVDHLCHGWDPTCPAGYVCPHRRCVNPDHLQAVPHRINMLRGQTVSAANSLKTHCSRGHELTSENLIKLSRGSRACKVCHRIRQAVYDAKS